jgi:selenophosphate synthase
MTDDGKACGNREALSIDPEKDDLYAMGGTPIMALAILCMPVDNILARWCAEFSKAGRWWIL